MPDKWHRYYLENDVKILLPSHVKIIDVLEGVFISETNAVLREQEEKAKAISDRKAGKGGFVPRKEGEKWQDEQGNTWQTIF